MSQQCQNQEENLYLHHALEQSLSFYHSDVAICRLQNNKNLFGGHDVRQVKNSAGHEVGDFCISRRPHHGWCRMGKILKFRHSKRLEIAIPGNNF